MPAFDGSNKVNSSLEDLIELELFPARRVLAKSETLTALLTNCIKLSTLSNMSGSVMTKTQSAKVQKALDSKIDETISAF